MLKTVSIILLTGIAFFQANADKAICVTPGRGLQPAFSPDGKQLIYVYESDEGAKQLFRLPLNKKNAKPVKIGINGTEPRRLNGTNKMVFFSDDLFPQINILNLKTNKSKIICPDTVPDGTCISLKKGNFAVPVKKDEKFKIFVYDPKNNKLKAGKFPVNSYSVSPNEKIVAVFTREEETSNFKVINVKTGKKLFHPKPVVGYGSMHPGGNHSPAFSPDGRYLAYVTAGIQPIADIVLVDLNTGKKTNITTDKADNQSPVFSPDGCSIAYSSNRGGKYRIWIKKYK